MYIIESQCIIISTVCQSDYMTNITDSLWRKSEWDRKL